MEILYFQYSSSILYYWY